MLICTVKAVDGSSASLTLAMVKFAVGSPCVRVRLAGVIIGGILVESVAEVPVLSVPPLVEVTLAMVFVCGPCALGLTCTVMVQVRGADVPTIPPVNLMPVSPVVKVPPPLSVSMPPQVAS